MGRCSWPSTGWCVQMSQPGRVIRSPVVSLTSSLPSPSVPDTPRGDALHDNCETMEREGVGGGGGVL